jgi:hypothetical protein
MLVSKHLVLKELRFSDCTFDGLDFKRTLVRVLI